MTLCCNRIEKPFIGRTFDWKQISAMFRLTWLSGVLFSWKIHTDRYRAGVELISSNCGLCCFTSPVWLQVSLPPSPPLPFTPSSSLGNCIMINIKHTHTPVAHTEKLQCTNKSAGFLLTVFSLARDQVAFQVLSLHSEDGQRSVWRAMYLGGS